MNVYFWLEAYKLADLKVRYKRSEERTFFFFLSENEIVDRLKAEEISPERGGELTHRVVMNTNSRLNKWGYLD